MTPHKDPRDDGFTVIGHYLILAALTHSGLIDLTMLDFDGFRQAIRLDFTDLSEDGSEFESLVQELLQAMGFYAERTGIGPDQGADIIAEEVLLDRLGIKQVRRYVVQCKHFAQSGKVVGRPHVTDIRDTIEQYQANGYILVTSTDVTSNLKLRLQKIPELHPEYTVQVWNHVSLEQRLNKYPALITKYFPNRFRHVKIVIPEPKGEKETFVRNRILAHQNDYVGSKYIPKLYVRRDIEESIQENLQPPIGSLMHLKKAVPEMLDRYISKVTSEFSIPKYLVVMNKPPIALAWTADLTGINKKVRQAGQRLLSYPWDPVSWYMTDGVRGVWKGFDDLARRHKRYAGLVESLIAPFLEFIQKTEPPEKKNKNGKDKGKAARRRRSRRSAADKISKSVPWLSDEFLKLHNLKSVEYTPPKDATTLLLFKKRLEQLRTELRDNPLSYVKNELERSQDSFQIVVDIAGSGKTNLCCRLALQLVNKSFVVFLTGKALGKEFSNLINYLEEEIKEALQPDLEMDLKSLCQWLQRMDYPLVIIFDGVNENSSPAQMKQNLQQLYDVIINCPAKALITSRVEYWNYYSNVFARDGFSKITAGKLAKFTEDEHEIAIPVYLDHYKIAVRLESKAWEQLKRPLILRFFCEAYGSPKRKIFRHLPPIKEVRLFHLFGEYCRVKYGNIRETLRAEGHFVTDGQVEEVSYSIAEQCLLNKTRALRANSLINSITTLLADARPIYRALLDEDIVIEETIEVRGQELERTTSFVYEAFMEYLMARVLLFRCGYDDSKLLSRVEGLLASEAEFVHSRGIFAFLLPHCVNRLPKTYGLILSQLRRQEYAENCVPILVNLWDSDWQQGIWPVLQSAAENLLIVPLEQLAVFVKDWVSEHHPGGFLRSVKSDPATAISILGTHIIPIVTNAKVDDRNEILESLLSLLKSAKTPHVAQEILYAIRRDDSLSANTILDKERLFSRLVKSCLPILDDIRHTDRSDRDWTVLDLLAKIGDQWKVKIDDVPRTEGLLLAAHNAASDGIYLKKMVNYERHWWADILGLNLGAIEAAVEKWVSDPVYDPELSKPYLEYVDYDLTSKDDVTNEIAELEDVDDLDSEFDFRGD